jgi:hypothetical protein
MTDKICPSCGRYIGLHDREGNHVACEWHNARVVDLEEEMDRLCLPGRGILFFVKRQWICNWRKNVRSLYV